MRNKQLDFKTDILPFLIATLGEFVALFFWLRFLNAGQFWAGQILLWAGFLVERTAVILWLRYVNGSDDPDSIAGSTPAKIIGAIVVLTLIEIVIWAVWLTVSDRMGMVVGAVLLAVMIHSLHSLEMAVVKKTPLGTFFTNRNTVFFSIMEFMGGTLWLYFGHGGNPMLGAACLLIGLSVEHLIQGATLKREDAKSLVQMRAI